MITPPFSFLLKDLAQLEARTAKQRAENARLRSEVRFLELARRKVDPFP
jgi:cell division protein FtsB